MNPSSRTARWVPVLLLALPLAACSDDAGSADDPATPAPTSESTSGGTEGGTGAVPTLEEVCAAAPVDELARVLGVPMKRPVVMGTAEAGGCSVDGTQLSLSLVLSVAPAAGSLEDRAAVLVRSGGEPAEVEVAGRPGLLVDESADGSAAVVVEDDGNHVVATLSVITAEVAPQAQVDAVLLAAEAVVEPS